MCNVWLCRKALASLNTNMWNPLHLMSHCDRVNNNSQKVYFSQNLKMHCLKLLWSWKESQMLPLSYVDITTCPRATFMYSILHKCIKLQKSFVLTLQCNALRDTLTLSAKQTKTHFLQKNVDPDETAHYELSDQSLHNFPFCYYFLLIALFRTIVLRADSKME